MNDTLVLLLAIGIPVALVLWWMRKPVSGAPRDALSSRAKSEAKGLALLLWPTRAYRETLIDDADDRRASAEREQ